MLPDLFVNTHPSINPVDNKLSRQNSIYHSICVVKITEYVNIQVLKGISIIITNLPLRYTRTCNKLLITHK